MRIMIVGHYYADMYREWYARHPGLDRLSYDEQRESLRSSLFGMTVFQSTALNELGHEAIDVGVNVWPAQATWAREHGHRVSRAPVAGLRLRGGLVPWPLLRRDTRWMGEVLLRQIDAFHPDIVHVLSMDVLEPALIREIRSRCRFVVGQIAARLTTERALAGYDLVLSSLPNFVDRFRRAGVESEWLPLAFGPSARAVVPPVDRHIAVSFTGSLFDVHGARARLIEAVGSQTTIDVWSADRARLRIHDRDQLRTHPPAWGVDMYGVLASSLRDHQHPWTHGGCPAGAR